MAKRPKYQRRKKDFKPGRLAPAPAGFQAAAIAARVRYIPSGEHKTYPSPTNQWTISHKADKSKCDRFDHAEWPRVEQALRAAILAGCIDAEYRGDFPARAWAYINDTLHEARLSNTGDGSYHGFPLEYPEQFPNDPDDLLRNAPRVAIPVH